MSIPASAKTITFIGTRDRDTAKAFYCGLLGFALIDEDEFAAVLDLNGIMLRISTVKDHQAQPHTVLGWDVTDIRDTIATLRGQGITFRIFDGFGQDEQGIWSAPDGTTKVAWFNDPDENLLSLSQF